MGNAIARVEKSWANLLRTLEGIPNDRMSEPGVAGDWSVKDVLAHIAYWEGRAMGDIERALSGEPDPPGDDLDVESVNQMVYNEREGWTVTQMLDELYGTHERMMVALRQHPGIDPGDIEGDTFEHYDEHAADIRAWRERAGI